MTSRRLGFALLLASPLAFASDNIDRFEYATCAAMKGDLDRLECFDDLAREYKVDGPQQEEVDTEDTGKWQVEKKINPIDDSVTVVLALPAESGRSKWGNKVVMVLRCQSNTTEAYVNWNDYLGSSTRVTSRVGNQPASTTSWGLSTDSQASFHPQAISFIRNMLGESKLVLQTTPYNESPVTAIFDIAGIDNAVVPLRETCGW